MSREMPAPIAAYFAGKSSNDIDAMIAPFGETAIVSDEGKEMRGLAAIRKEMDDRDKQEVPAPSTSRVSQRARLGRP